MSYEPTLIVKIDDLEKQKVLFEDLQYYLPDENTRGGEEGKTLLETLKDLYFENDKWIVDVWGFRCRYFTPHFSTYNSEIREKLDELGILMFVSEGSLAHNLLIAAIKSHIYNK